MSAKVMGQVWEVALPANEQIILLSLADHADHEGHNIFPSDNLTAWKCGYSRRTVIRLKQKLIERGVLVEDVKRFGGTTIYSINIDAAPKKKPRKNRGVCQSVTCDIQVSHKPSKRECTSTNTENSGTLSRETEIQKSSAERIAQIAEQVYRLYPKKVARPKALVSIIKQIRAFGSEKLLKATALFAEAWASKRDLQYCPHPTTWFNQERFNDDPSTWQPKRSPSAARGCL